MGKNEDNEVVTRLNTMIGLLVENMMASGLVGKGRAIEILSAGGLGPTEIGKIIGLPTTSVGSLLSRKKRKRASKKVKR